MAKKKSNPDPVAVTRTQEEVDAVVDTAAEKINQGRSKFPGMTYEEGVRAALDWITGNIDDHPMED